MLILASTSQIIRVVTDLATDVDVVASYVDRLGSTFTPDSDDTRITTATTTTVVSSPAASTERNVKGMTIRNRDTTAVGIKVQWYNGTTAITLIEENLDPGQEIVFDSAGGWTLTDRVPRLTRAVIPGSKYERDGTYRKPRGVQTLFVECVGAGGDGGGCTTAATNSAAGGGGSAGGYVTAWINNPDDQYRWVIISAAGGANVVGAAFGVTAWTSPAEIAGLILASNGSNGGSDTVTTIHTGGTGGYRAGTLGAGEAGVSLAAAQMLSGRGGSGPYGNGGQSVKNSTSAGVSASGNGAGGSGATIASGGASQVGGAGSPGLIVVTEYYQ